MTPEITDAIENARTVGSERGTMRLASYDQRRHSTNCVKAIVASVARDLPPEMTVGELLEELESK